jgi:hypothetical protein
VRFTSRVSGKLTPRMNTYRLGLVMEGREESRVFSLPSWRLLAGYELNGGGI